MPSSQAFCPTGGGPFGLSSQLLTWTTLILLGLSTQCLTFGLFATPFPYASFASNGPGLIVIYSMLTHWLKPPFPVASKSSISTYILLLLNISVFFLLHNISVLKLKDGILLNPPFGLRILQLRNVKYANCDSLSTLLTACSLL
ncbi:hypothetical protein CMV_004567 [Castanea mollissima]|uniref:Uncharacterized protein n=1 Tax=Castanea mollissima TaxID=60419 RepID=A0A8J4VTQ5_9ROSI|nr:hypothetical protein CMV_004567 [Castanea mollissima]